MGRAMIRPALLYGAAIAALSLLLTWMDWRHIARDWTVEFYVALVALLFTSLGAWLGTRLAPRTRPAPFVRNMRAIASLGISPRECEVLDLLAMGHPNKVIARRLDISPNTVKTHLARLYEKLGANTRTEAIARARELHMLP